MPMVTEVREKPAQILLLPTMLAFCLQILIVLTCCEQHTPLTASIANKQKKKTWTTKKDDCNFWNSMPILVLIRINKKQGLGGNLLDQCTVNDPYFIISTMLI